MIIKREGQHSVEFSDRSDVETQGMCCLSKNHKLKNGRDEKRAGKSAGSKRTYQYLDMVFLFLYLLGKVIPQTHLFDLILLLLRPVYVVLFILKDVDQHFGRAFIA